MKIILPAVLNPISRRKDKSVKISVETREMTPEETLTLMAMEGEEMWLCLAPNENELETPEENAEVEEKTPSQRMKAVIYILYKQEFDSGKYIGTFDTVQELEDDGALDVMLGIF